MAVVYLHTNRENGKVYVGQTWQKPEARWISQRDAALRTQKGGCRHFYAAIRKYGWDLFDHKILTIVDTQAALDAFEKLWIIVLRANDPRFGYNLQSGGSRGIPGYVSRHRMSLAAKSRAGRTCSPETRKKISEAQKGVPKPASFALIESHKNSPKVLENCRILGARHKGKPWSAARRVAQNLRKEDQKYV